MFGFCRGNDTVVVPEISSAERVAEPSPGTPAGVRGREASGAEPHVRPTRTGVARDPRGGRAGRGETPGEEGTRHGRGQGSSRLSGNRRGVDRGATPEQHAHHAPRGHRRPGVRDHHAGGGILRCHHQGKPRQSVHPIRRERDEGKRRQHRHGRGRQLRPDFLATGRRRRGGNGRRLGWAMRTDRGRRRDVTRDDGARTNHQPEGAEIRPEHPGDHRQERGRRPPPPLLEDLRHGAKPKCQPEA